MSELSATKAAAILVTVQKNPEISTENATYVARLIDECATWIVGFCHLSGYNELCQGTTTSGASPNTDITDAATNKLSVSVNGSGFFDIEPVLASCDTGSNIATELQSKIRAIDSDGFDEVTVAYADSLYTATSGRYGESSSVEFSSVTNYRDVVRELKLTPMYGAVSKVGGMLDEQLDQALVSLVEIVYAKVGAEGLERVSLTGGLSFSSKDLPKRLKSTLVNIRRWQ